MISLSEISKGFEDSLALDKISLEIPRGSCFGLLGSNGAGKSTILRLLSGIYQPDSGTVTIEGETVFDNVNVKRRVFFISDETVQYGSFTLNGLAEFYSAYYPNFSYELFDRLVAIVKLPLDKKISDFSKGMKRQAIVITALSCRTDYLLLDEALDGLDPTMRLIVKQMLVDEMLDRQITVVISSHNLREINEICDRVSLLHNGKIVFTRAIDDVSDKIHKLQLAFEEKKTKESFAPLDILHFEETQSVQHLICRGTSEEIEAVIKPMRPLVFDILPLSLEEVFLYEMEVLGYDFNQFRNEK